MKSLKYPQEVLGDVKKHLQAQEAQILQQIDALKEQDPYVDTERLNDNAASDQDASEEFNHERYQAMLSELNLQLEATREALVRIERGTYGVCEKCSNVIDTDRLAALVTARLCMQCASLKK